MALLQRIGKRVTPWAKFASKIGLSRFRLSPVMEPCSFLMKLNSLGLERAPHKIQCLLLQNCSIRVRMTTLNIHHLKQFGQGFQSASTINRSDCVVTPSVSATEQHKRHSSTRKHGRETWKKPTIGIQMKTSVLNIRDRCSSCFHGILGIR